MFSKSRVSYLLFFIAILLLVFSIINFLNFLIFVEVVLVFNLIRFFVKGKLFRDKTLFLIILTFGALGAGIGLCILVFSSFSKSYKKFFDSYCEGF